MAHDFTKVVNCWTALPGAKSAEAATTGTLGSRLFALDKPVPMEHEVAPVVDPAAG